MMRFNPILFCLALTLLSIYFLMGSESAEAVPAGALPSPIDSASVDKREILTWPSWTENKNYSAYLKDKNVLLDKISFRTSETRRGIAVFVDKFSRKPASVSEVPGVSYAFLQISLNKAAAESADKLTFYFTVEDSWLEFNTLTERDIRLMAYDQGSESWTVLDAKLENGIFSVSSHLNYSIFSIAGIRPPSQQEALEKARMEAKPSNDQEKRQEKEQPAEETPEPVKETAPADKMESKAKEEFMSPSSEEEETPKEPEETSRTAGIISSILLFVLGAALVIFGVKRWKK